MHCARDAFRRLIRRRVQVQVRLRGFDVIAVRQRLHQRANSLRTAIVSEPLPDEAVDFFARCRDQSDRPSDDERDRVRNGDIIVVHRGQSQSFAVLADGKHPIFARQVLVNEIANRFRNGLAAPDGGLLASPRLAPSGPVTRVFPASRPRGPPLSGHRSFQDSDTASTQAHRTAA